MAALLRKAGHSVAVVENGNQAVAAVRDGDYDVVLMDVQMPELDGIEATRQIRAMPPPKHLVPIIALTAHAMRGAKEEYLAAGMDDFVSKPIDAALLLDKLARLPRGGRPAPAAHRSPSPTSRPPVWPNLTRCSIPPGSTRFWASCRPGNCASLRCCISRMPPSAPRALRRWPPKAIVAG